MKSPQCTDASCPKKFRDKSCKCRTVQGDACEPIKTVCAYEEDGTLYGCPTGCCNNQCGGQCGSPMYEDTATPTKYAPIDIQIKKYIMALVILLVGLLLLSSVSV
jgi:hypothetical protein